VAGSKFTMKFSPILTYFVLLSQLPAAAPAGSSGNTVFDGRRALANTIKAVSFGQRPSGSAELERTRAWILSELAPLNAAISKDAFSALTPAGAVPMVNTIARFKGTSGKAIVITGHYDTKRMPMVNFVGANDGGSSTGFLLELARAVARQKRTDDLYLVWLDGEEAVGQWSATDSRYGSRHLAGLWSADGTLARTKALINVDMIGDRDLGIVSDVNSSKSLRDLIWKTAASLGDAKYFLPDEGAIEDDHQPFIAAGVNGADLIDFNFGPDNSYWHTDKDTTDKLGAHSFQVVGDVLLRVISSLERQ
jgi:glutaminyl-peptide cyclotransferase